MDYYDPEVAPAPEKWNALDQMERMFLIEDYHSQTQDLADSPQGHATIHAIVENQVAMGGATPVAAELDRLMHEGLGRHDAVHAVGAILLEHMHTAMEGDPDEDPETRNQRYYANLKKMTAKKWRGMA